ncbi:apolipoprotein N-acyltransferase [Paracoccus suum]|nr:apolipoprotein N-acyltransferase [Paracoccus suum]
MSRRQRALAVAAPVAIGAVASLGFAPFSFWPATPIALALGLAIAAQAPTARAAGIFGLLLGAGYFGAALSWIVDPFLVEPQVTGWMAPFALVLMALGGGLFWAAPLWLAARLVPGPRPLPRAAAMAATVLLSEWLRGFIFTGFPWAQPGQAWLGSPVAQLAAIGGQLGLTALTLTLATLPFALRTRRQGWLGITLALALFALAWIAGEARLHRASAADTGLTIRLVQPDADQALKWDADWAAEFYRRLITLSQGPTSEGRRPDAVIWPETAVSFLLNDAGPALPQMAEAAGGAPLLTGIQRAEGPRWFNSLVEITPQGTVGAAYDKFHLVPFGEYIPGGDALARFGIRAFAAQAGFGYTPGPGPQVMHIPGLPPFQPLICYEAVFPQHLREVPQRPQWLLQVTNDAWFGKFSGPWQHLAQARLRAIETGLPVMRAANTGVSAAIDPMGRLTARLDLGEQGRIDARLPAPLPPTLWLAWGNLPAVLFALIVLAAAITASRRPLRRIDARRADP